MRERLGLRPEDLSDGERDALAAWRADPANAAEERAEQHLAASIAALPSAPGPTVGRARARLAAVRRRAEPVWQRHSLVTATVVALAASALLVTLPVPRPSVALGVDSVQLAANVVGDRVLAPGAAVRAQEQVALQITTAVPGWLTVVEEGVGVVMSERLDAGTHEVLLGSLGARPAVGGTRLYRALLCETQADATTDFDRCATIALPLRIEG